VTVSEARELDVDLAIDSEELLAMYRGAAREVIARAADGRVVRFPATVLRPFVDVRGVHGRFRIRFGADNRFRGIVRID
jgi:hypothetical protein